MSSEASTTAPLVSIIIPCFNQREFVAEGVRAAFGQSHPNCEVIVIDDASTDGSGEYLERLRQELDFQLIRNRANVGLNETLQRGLNAARGEFVSMIAADDVLASDKVGWQVEYLGKTSLDAVYGTGWLLFEGGRTELIELSDFERHFADGSVLERLYVDDTRGPLMQTALFKRDVITSLWQERGEFKSDDWVTLLRLLERYEVGFVNRPCFYYRQHAGNSYRDYWRTLPMRIEVIANVTPAALRNRAMANLLYSLGQYSAGDRKIASAVKFLVASFFADPSFGRALTVLVDVSKAVARPIFRRGNR